MALHGACDPFGAAAGGAEPVPPGADGAAATDEAPPTIGDAGTLEPGDGSLPAPIDGNSGAAACCENGVCCAEACDRGGCLPTACAPGERATVLHPESSLYKTGGPWETVPPMRAHATVVDEPIADEGASLIRHRSGAADDTPERTRFGVEALALPPGARITSVNAWARARRETSTLAGGMQVGLHIKDPDDKTHVSTLLPIRSVMFQDGHADFASSPFRGGAWTLAELQQVHLVVGFDPRDANSAVDVTKAWLEVCTAPP